MTFRMLDKETADDFGPCLQVHLGYRPHDAQGINVRDLAYDARGFTGAQLGSLVNTAAGLAGREGREMITQADLRKVGSRCGA